MIAITAAPTSPVSCVRAPADSATGVRDALLEIGNPWNNPVAAFARPSAMTSWFGLTSRPSREANVRDSTLVSAKATSAMPIAAAESDGRSDVSTSGSSNEGSPRGSEPTTAISSASPKTATAAMEKATATSTPGTLGASRRRTRTRTIVPDPISSAGRTTCPSPNPSANATSCRIDPSASTE